MMWLMMLCCALPILLLVLFGGKLAGNSIWLIFGVMAMVMVVHLFIHRHHRPSDEESHQDKHQDNKDNSHSGRGCH